MGVCSGASIRVAEQVAAVRPGQGVARRTPSELTTLTLMFVQKQQASITTRIEGEMAGKASNGPLTIMKSAADGAAAEKAAQQKKKSK